MMVQTVLVFIFVSSSCLIGFKTADFRNRLKTDPEMRIDIDRGARYGLRRRVARGLPELRHSLGGRRANNRPD